MSDRKIHERPKNAYSEILMHQSRFSFYSEVAFFRVIFFLKIKSRLLNVSLMRWWLHLLTCPSRAAQFVASICPLAPSYQRKGRENISKINLRNTNDSSRVFSRSCTLFTRRCIVDADSSDSRDATVNEIYQISISAECRFIVARRSFAALLPAMVMNSKY